MTETGPTSYGKIKVGVKTLEDAVFNLGDLVKNKIMFLSL